MRLDVQAVTEQEPEFVRLLAEAVEAQLAADAADFALIHYPGLPLHTITYRYEMALQQARHERWVKGIAEGKRAASRRR